MELIEVREIFRNREQYIDKDIEIGDGGVICNHDKLLPLQNNFRVIPINYI